jgi:hypothetical protein
VRRGVGDTSQFLFATFRPTARIGRLRGAIGLRAGGGDAPDGVADVVGDQKRSALVDGDSDRATARLAVRVKEIRDDVLGFAIGAPAAEGHEHDPVAVELRPVPTSVFADERTAAIFCGKLSAA